MGNIDMPRKSKKYHYIYKTTNVINNKFYIGMHSTHDLDDGYIGSGKRLRYSINKHGKENHICEILEFLPSRDLLREREKEIVDNNLLQDSLCMNLTYGGGYGWAYINQDSDLQRAKGKKANARMKILRETDEEWTKSVSTAISDSLKSAYKDGRRTVNTPDWSGKTHTAKTKHLMSEVKKGKHMGGENSQYGTMWITDGTISKKIKKMEPIPNGWMKGRTMNKTS